MEACSVLAVSLLLAALGTIMAAAGAEPLQAYLVHLSHDAQPQMPLSLWHSSLISAATSATSAATSATSAAASQRLLYSYHYALHGFAALLSSSEASFLEASEAVVALHKDKAASTHTTRTPAFLGLTSSESMAMASSPLWTASSQGRNAIIGIIDTGIWPSHPSFSDTGLDAIADHRPNWNGTCPQSFPCNRKIISARYYYKGYEASSGHPINQTLEFESPLDNDGHGTHTSSTAAGSFVSNASFLGSLAAGTASGVAPLARIAVYKACWEKGQTCSFVDILAAFDDAISDGVDVISVSLGTGSSTDYFSDTIAIGAFAAVARGIVVACSAGNDGPALGTVANGAPWIFTVAASTIDRDFPAPVTLGDGSVYEGTSLYAAKSAVSSSPLIYAGSAAASAAAEVVANASVCSSADYFNRTEVNGKMVVCETGYVSSVVQSLAVQEAGGVAMIVGNPAFYGEMLQASAHIAPGTRVGYAEGTAIKNYINGSAAAAGGGGNPTASIEFDGTRIGTRAPSMAAFSSRGPHLTSIAVLKPDITAPGLNVLAAWTAFNSPSEVDQDTRRVLFNIISGTSMSCPHVAGLSALLKAAHPTWSPAAIRSALMTTASVLDNSGGPILDTATSDPADPLTFGSGHVTPNLALDPGLVYDLGTQDYVDFLCRLNSSLLHVYKGYQTTYTCSDPLPAFEDLNYPSFSVSFHQSAHNSSDNYFSTFSRTLTNVGLPDSTYIVSISPPDFVNVSVFPSTLSFDSQHPILSYSISFAAPKLVSLSENTYTLSFGSLYWSDDQNHIVRSPISFIWY